MLSNRNQIVTIFYIQESECLFGKEASTRSSYSDLSGAHLPSMIRVLYLIDICNIGSLHNEVHIRNSYKNCIHCHPYELGPCQSDEQSAPNAIEHLQILLSIATSNLYHYNIINYEILSSLNVDPLIDSVNNFDDRSCIGEVHRDSYELFWRVQVWKFIM